MSDNRKLAENSFILYFRLLVTTFIGLYVSRIVLLQLGADNFGLYAVVGGLVAMMNLLNTTMISTSNRFIAFEIGKKENNGLNTVFNTLLVIHIFFSILLLVIVEIFGVWYIRNYLNIDPAKINDALFVLHFSTLTAVVSTVIIPYQGMITAHEKFKVKAGIDVAYSLLNLLAVLLLIFGAGNKLRRYSVYAFSVQIIVALAYYIFCTKNFRLQVGWKINRNKADYREISKFFGWQLVYVTGSVGSNQGGAIIINHFFGTILNAAFGVASRVHDFVYSFVKNLNQAALPQIIKSYSGGNQGRSLQLVYKLSKLTFFIMLIPAVPIVLSIDNILILWLKKVPVFTAYFVVLRIVHGLVSCLESGFDATIDATGKIRVTKILFSFLFLIVLPVVWLFYKMAYPPYMLTIFFILAELLFLIVQTIILSKLTEFSIIKYITSTILPVMLVVLLILPQYFLRSLFGPGFIDFIILSVISGILTLGTIYLVGLNKEEKTIIVDNLKKITTKNALFIKLKNI